jgi:hypothetical protein
MRAIAMATVLALLPVRALLTMFGATASRVKSSCCGPADAHHLTPDQVTRRDEDYYLVAGYARPTPVKRALPSQGGEYWIGSSIERTQTGSRASTASSCRWRSERWLEKKSLRFSPLWTGIAIGLRSVSAPPATPSLMRCESPGPSYSG